MEKKENMPLWVFLALSSISTRRGALLLIFSCLVFSIYCIPWPLFFAKYKWVNNIFLISDWSWLAMMVSMTIWYLVSLRWMDNNSAWDN